MELPLKAVQWVESVLGDDAKIVNVSKLLGGTGTGIHRVEIEKEGNTTNYVLRRFTNRAWLKIEPDLARHEAESLIAAQQGGLLAPDLIAYDEDGLKSDLPSVLMTFLPGEAVLQPEDMGEWLIGLAKLALEIHQAGIQDFPRKYYTYHNVQELVVPVWSNQPEVWEQALGSCVGRARMGSMPLFTVTFTQQMCFGRMGRSAVWWIG